MQNLNKKALGESVATFALIVITIAAVALAGFSILHVISANANIQASPQFKCLNNQFQLNQVTRPIQLVSACVNPEGKIEATVQRSQENVQINSFTFNINQETFTCTSNAATCSTCNVLQPNTIETYFITPQNDPADKMLVFSVENCEMDTIKIVPC